MSSFMTPLESRQSLNINKVRMFSYNDLQSPERDEKWDCVKIVCTQPFNRHVQYGLSFITLHSSEGNDLLNSSVNLGKFTLRPDSPNNLAVGGLFARRKEMDITSPISAAAAIREASSSSSVSTKPFKPTPIPKDKQTPKRTNSTENGNTSPKPRNRQELLYNKDEEETHEKIDKIIKKRQKELEEKAKKDEEAKKAQKKKDEDAKKTPKKKDEAVLSKKQSDNIGKIVSSSSSTSNKRKVESTPSTSSKKHRVGKEKPYNKLLEGVIIVISGIQNPERAEIRNKALQLGAKYKPDWDNTCTHLICAFTNTPKFHQVKGKGKIVNRVWIQDCHSQRKRLPWRRYALDPKDLNGVESEEEISEEIQQLPDVEILHTKSTFDEDTDTEDEIERITSLNNSASSTVLNNFLIDTDEEDFYSNLNKKIEIPELPSLLTNKIMYVDDAFSDDRRKQMIRYIIALNGIISDVPLGVDVMITSSDKVDLLKEVCSTAQFVNPNWLWDSYNQKKLLSTDDYKL